MPVILSSNIIWYAYWSTVNNKFSDLVYSYVLIPGLLISPLYVEDEEWFDNKLYYKKIKNITNTKNFEVYLQ